MSIEIKQSARFATLFCELLTSVMSNCHSHSSDLFTAHARLFRRISTMRIGPNLGVTRNPSAYKMPSLYLTIRPHHYIQWYILFSITSSSMTPTCTTNPSQNITPSMRRPSDPGHQLVTPDQGLRNSISPPTTRFVHLLSET